MRYEQARPFIKDGDMIAVRRRDGLVAAATRFFTRDDETHVGIAIWLDGGLWLAELNGGGNHLVPMSQFDGVPFDVYDCPVHRDRVRDAILFSLRHRVHYGLAAFAAIGLLSWLHIQVTGRQRRIICCTGYVINCYIDAGWPERTRMMAPGLLAKALEFKFEVSPTE
jgi:hypothetical protein